MSTRTRAYRIVNNRKIIPGLLSKPEQGKKSKEFSELIHKALQHHTNILNFYICPNRRNQANQAQQNFMDYNEYYQEDKHSISVLHGEKDASKDADGYIYRAENNGERLIISLSNPTRMKVVKEIIIKWVKRNPLNKVKIYLDEAGDPKTINCFINHIWKDLEDNIGTLSDIYPIFIDAHTKALLNNKNFAKYFPKETLKKFENKYDLRNYMFISSMNYIPYEFENSSDILDKIHSQHISIDQDDYILWPLPKVKRGQYEDVEEIIHSIEVNCCVLIINGDGFHIYNKINHGDHTKKTLSKSPCKKRSCCGQITCPKCYNIPESELAQIKRIKQHYATNIPLILCGHDCIDRAMTYHEPGFSFTKAFIARQNLLFDPFCRNLTDKHFDELSDSKQEQISQMIKRTSGSFRESYDNGMKLPIIYGPQDIYDGIVRLEKTSQLIANQKGYLTKDARNKMDVNLQNISLLNEDEMERLDIELEPFDHFMKIFHYKGDDRNIQCELSEFRQSIGGATVHIATVTKRKNGIEPDYHLGELSLESLKTNIRLLKLGLNDKTNSRIRVCKDENDDIYFIVAFLMKRNTFKWKNNEYKITLIEKDGNCLFDSVIKSNLIEGLKDINRMRRDIRQELSNNHQKYDYSNEYSEDDWDDECDYIKTNYAWNNKIFDYCINAISNLYKINIHIFETEQLTNGAYEFKHFHSTPENMEHTKNIYLMRSNDNHYDLMIKSNVESI